MLGGSGGPFGHGGRLRVAPRIRLLSHRPLALFLLVGLLSAAAPENLTGLESCSPYATEVRLSLRADPATLASMVMRNAQSGVSACSITKDGGLQIRSRATADRLSSSANAPGTSHTWGTNGSGKS